MAALEGKSSGKDVIPGMQAADRNAEVEMREQTAAKKAGEVVKRDGKKQDNKTEGAQNKAVDGDSATGGEGRITAASAMSGAELRVGKESAEVGTVDGLLGESERTETLKKDIAMEAEVAESKRTGGLKPGEKTSSLPLRLQLVALQWKRGRRK
ncbi:hypothetical protein NQZ68_040495 [Dissostichus eleginoides]|nr:hypothetical protein NQZ68_040495 [Dissostichus eleginoides]